MRNLANFLLFQAGWLACVLGAAQGRMWVGPVLAAAIVAVHLRFVARHGERGRELGILLVAGLAGMLADSGFRALDLTRYPTSEVAWPLALVPPWITALWVLFATLPRHSLAWLAERPALAAALGAIGGPLAFFAGSRTGAIATGAEPRLTWAALALEYALATPLLLRLSRRSA